METKTGFSWYVTQTARDAEAMEYGGRDYWNDLEASTCIMAARFFLAGNYDDARRILTRSLGDALAGNDGV